MKYSLLLMFLCVIGSISSKGQSRIAETDTRAVVVVGDDSIVKANVLKQEVDIKIQSASYYHWFNSNHLFQTKGGFYGKLLHGNYNCFYASNELKEKGQFYFGLKKGRWIKWYINGETAMICNWKNGLLHGSYSIFNSNGKIIESGSYKKGKLHGSKKTFVDGEISLESKFKHGEVVTKSDKNNTKKKNLSNLISFFKRKKKGKNINVKG